MAPLVEAAPAKLNLDLYAEGRRADGYHLLDSIVAFTAFGDTLEVDITDRADDLVVVQGPLAAELEAAGESLVGRALAGLRRLTGRPARFAVRLTKRIPLAAGLGGGSADAAAALRAGARLLGLRQDDPALLPLATELGADVPACLACRPVRMRGIGERLEPAPKPPRLALVLVNPRVPAPTAAVYRRLEPEAFGPAPPRRAGAGPLPEWLLNGRNALEAAAVAEAPAIGEVVTLLERTEAPVVRLCGSGATVFAGFVDEEAAAAAAAWLRAERPTWWIEETRLA